jgi:hypothetical protein
MKNIFASTSAAIVAAVMFSPVVAQTPSTATSAGEAATQPPKVRTGLRLPDVQLPDPWILAEKSTQTYYLDTSAPTRLTGQIRTSTFDYKSKDLATWEGPFVVFVCPDDSWAASRAGAGAPEVYTYKGRCCLFTTLRDPEKTLATFVPSRPNLMRSTPIVLLEIRHYGEKAGELSLDDDMTKPSTPRAGLRRGTPCAPPRMPPTQARRLLGGEGRAAVALCDSHGVAL